MPVHALDLVPAIARLERQAVDEGHQRADHLGAAQVGDVHAVDRARDRVELQDLLEPLEPLARVDVEDLGLGVLGEVAAQVEALQGLDLVAEPGGLLELELLARLAHLLLHLLEQDVLLAVEEELQAADVGAVALAIDPQVAGGRALVDRVEQAGAEPSPAGIVLLDVQRAGAELEDPLEDLDGAAEALGPRERAVELDAAVERLAGEVDAGEVLAGRDLQVGEGLVVLEVAVVLGLDVLDQPGFHQQGVDLAVGGEELDVGDLVDPVADAAVVGGPLVEVRTGPAPQVLGLADVDDPPLGVLHQVEARGRGELLDLLGRRDRCGCGHRYRCG